MSYADKEKGWSYTKICTFIRLQKSCVIIGRLLDYDMDSMHRQYKQVIYSDRKSRKRAVTSISTFQDQRIKELTFNGDTEASAIKKSHEEVICSQNRRIQTMLGKSKDTGATEEISVDPVTHAVITSTKKSEVEQANIKNLPEHFLYADNTSLHTSPLLGKFGYSSDTSVGDEVPTGTYISLDRTDEYKQITKISAA